MVLESVIKFRRILQAFILIFVCIQLSCCEDQFTLDESMENRVNNSIFPKILWIYWSDPKTMPQKEMVFYNYLKYLMSKEQHKDWKLVLVTNQNLKDYISEYQIFEKTINSSKQRPYANVGDLVRLFLLEQHGGLYTDLATLFFEDLSWLQIQNLYQNSDIVNRHPIDSPQPQVLLFMTPVHQYRNFYYDRFLNLRNNNPGYESYFIVAKAKSKFIKQWRDKFVQYYVLKDSNQIFQQFRQHDIYHYKFSITDYWTVYYAMFFVLQVKQKELDDVFSFQQRLNVNLHYKIWGINCKTGPCQLKDPGVPNAFFTLSQNQTLHQRKIQKLRYFIKFTHYDKSYFDYLFSIFNLRLRIDYKAININSQESESIDKIDDIYQGLLQIDKDKNIPHCKLVSSQSARLKLDGILDQQGRLNYKSYVEKKLTDFHSQFKGSAADFIYLNKMSLVTKYLFQQQQAKEINRKDFPSKQNKTETQKGNQMQKLNQLQRPQSYQALHLMFYRPNQSFAYIMIIPLFSQSQINELKQKLEQQNVFYKAEQHMKRIFQDINYFIFEQQHTLNFLLLFGVNLLLLVFHSGQRIIKLLVGNRETMQIKRMQLKIFSQNQIQQQQFIQLSQNTNNKKGLFTEQLSIFQKINPLFLLTELIKQKTQLSNSDQSQKHQKHTNYQSTAYILYSYLQKVIITYTPLLVVMNFFVLQKRNYRQQYVFVSVMMVLLIVWMKVVDNVVVKCQNKQHKGQFIVKVKYGRTLGHFLRKLKKLVVFLFVQIYFDQMVHQFQYSMFGSILVVNLMLPTIHIFQNISHLGNNSQNNIKYDPRQNNILNNILKHNLRGFHQVMLLIVTILFHLIPNIVFYRISGQYLKLRLLHLMIAYIWLLILIIFLGQFVSFCSSQLKRHSKQSCLSNLFSSFALTRYILCKYAQVLIFSLFFHKFWLQLVSACMTNSYMPIFIVFVLATLTSQHEQRPRIQRKRNYNDESEREPQSVHTGKSQLQEFNITHKKSINLFGVLINAAIIYVVLNHSQISKLLTYWYQLECHDLELQQFIIFKLHPLAWLTSLIPILVKFIQQNMTQFKIKKIIYKMW